ncbi:MAG: hypothetical protein ACRC46_14645 [Thermoguttaceae bacterium]
MDNVTKNVCVGLEIVFGAMFATLCAASGTPNVKMGGGGVNFATTASLATPSLVSLTPLLLEAVIAVSRSLNCWW